MKRYDYNKARKIIEVNSNNIQEASLGMYEDWFWTAETVWDNGGFTNNLTKGTKIGGISGSHWATPTLELHFKDGERTMIPCFVGKSKENKPKFICLGVLSGPVQESLPPLSESDDNPTT